MTGKELFVLMMGRLFRMVAFVVAGLFKINLKIIGHIGWVTVTGEKSV
jgi:hypothetical protein